MARVEIITTQYEETIKDYDGIVKLRREVNKRQDNKDASTVVAISSLLTISQPILSLLLSITGTALGIIEDAIAADLEGQEDLYTEAGEIMQQSNYDAVKLRQKYKYVKTYNQVGDLLHEGWIADGTTEVIAYHGNTGWDLVQY
ncbi:hypothetical protein [Caldisalinibacter kiritimatiensis]|uniref:Uncharacterized protein n=1 Tax=Caldisalinibacter kiritimatiensis TaxID=1304284 RepID=R1CNT8_9FIRM|nr:hypothetical protein [Caldisalinibacter kiritimatiensis]EOD00366.1 hypothetical protein L21TH_1588 [Caldisalinibacter kiritimatiensis]